MCRLKMRCKQTSVVPTIQWCLAVPLTPRSGDSSIGQFRYHECYRSQSDNIPMRNPKYVCCRNGWLSAVRHGGLVKSPPDNSYARLFSRSESRRTSCSRGPNIRLLKALTCTEQSSTSISHHDLPCFKRCFSVLYETLRLYTIVPAGKGHGHHPTTLDAGSKTLKLSPTTLLIRVFGVTARSRKDRLVWSGFSSLSAPLPVVLSLRLTACRQDLGRWPHCPGCRPLERQPAGLKSIHNFLSFSVLGASPQGALPRVRHASAGPGASFRLPKNAKKGRGKTGFLPLSTIDLVKPACEPNGVDALPPVFAGRILRQECRWLCECLHRRLW